MFLVLFNDACELFSAESYRLSVLKEGVLKQLVSRGPLLWVLCETDLDEVSHVCRPPPRVELWRIHRQNHVADLRLGHVEVRGLAICELKHHDAETPDVYFLSVHLCGSDDLWRHPAHSAYLRIALAPLPRKLSGVSEIAKLNITSRAEEDVV